MKKLNVKVVLVILLVGFFLNGFSSFVYSKEINDAVSSQNIKEQDEIHNSEMPVFLSSNGLPDDIYKEIIDDKRDGYSLPKDTERVLTNFLTSTVMETTEIIKFSLVDDEWQMDSVGLMRRVVCDSYLLLLFSVTFFLIFVVGLIIQHDFNLTNSIRFYVLTIFVVAASGFFGAFVHTSIIVLIELFFFVLFKKVIMNDVKRDDKISFSIFLFIIMIMLLVSVFPVLNFSAKAFAQVSKCSAVTCLAFIVLGFLFEFKRMSTKLKTLQPENNDLESKKENLEPKQNLMDDEHMKERLENAEEVSEKGRLDLKLDNRT